MKFRYNAAVITAMVILHFFPINRAVAGSVEGLVVDRDTGQPISNVNVTVSGTQVGAATDSAGIFKLIGLKDGEYIVHFSHIGFLDHERSINVVNDRQISLNIQLSPSVLHLGTVVITTTRGLKDRFDCPVASDVVSRSSLEHRNTMSMADAFDQLPGVSLSTTGKGSIRPVIRGMYDAHVLTLLNGIPMNDLRPGGDHVMLIEPEQIERMEVVKGPGSVLYGSDAIGGMVNFVTMPRNPFTNDGIDYTWKLRSGYDSNGNLYQAAAELGIGSDKRFVKGRYGHKVSGNMTDPEHEIPNSNYRGDHFDLMGGLRSDPVDIDLVCHYLIADVGVPINPAVRHSVFEDEKQKFSTLSGRWKTPTSYLASVETNFSWQRHNRHFHMIQPFNLNPDTLEQDMQIFVNTDAWSLQVIPTTPLSDSSLLKYGVELLLQSANSDRKSFTADLFTGQQNTLVPPRVIPDSRRWDMGLFIEDETNWRDFSFFTGVRYDRVRAESYETDRSPIPPSDIDKQAFSGNLGFVWHLKQGMNLTGQIGRAFRSPTLLELFFWGPHQTTVDRGNPDLKPETSLNLDLGLNQRRGRFEWSINGFQNTVHDYIYKRQTGVVDPASGLLIDSWENLSNVRFIGGEVQGAVYPWKTIGIFGSLSYVEATDLDSEKPVPDIPPLNGSLSIRHSGSVVSVDIGANFAAKQDRIASNETETAAYAVCNGSMGINLERWLRVSSKLTLSATNLLDAKYCNHLSRTKLWYFEPGRSVSLALTLAR